jgi:hypothetical protein
MVKQFLITIYAMLVIGGIKTIEELPEEYRQPVTEYLAAQ